MSEVGPFPGVPGVGPGLRRVCASCAGGVGVADGH